jgi:hypothetical protein
MQYFFEENKTIQVHTLRVFLWLMLKGTIIGNKSPTMVNLQRKIANENVSNPPRKLAATFAKTERLLPSSPIRVHKTGYPDVNVF